MNSYELIEPDEQVEGEYTHLLTVFYPNGIVGNFAIDGVTVREPIIAGSFQGKTVVEFNSKLAYVVIPRKLFLKLSAVDRWERGLEQASLEHTYNKRAKNAFGGDNA